MATFHRNGGNFGPEWVATFKRNGGSFAPDYAMPVLSKKYKTISMKIMILGIEITLIGGIVAVDPNSSLGGFEYIITLVGLIVTIVGLYRQDEAE